jgi:hypothetical protein
LAAAFGHAIGVILVGLRRTGHADGWTAGCCGGCGRPVGAIPASIVRAQIERPPKGFNTKESECTALETRIALAGFIPQHLEHLGQRSSLTCPECGGVLWQSARMFRLEIVFHTGHPFFCGDLESQQQTGVEEALRSATRRLQEVLLLMKDQIARAQAARSPQIANLRARAASLETAKEAARQLAMTFDITIKNKTTRGGALDAMPRQASVWRRLATSVVFRLLLMASVSAEGAAPDRRSVEMWRCGPKGSP